MRPLLPPGLIVVATLVSFGKLKKTACVRLKADPASIVEALDAVQSAAEEMVTEGAARGEFVVLSLHGILPGEPVPAVCVHTNTCRYQMPRAELAGEIAIALTSMLYEFIDAAAKPKAPPAPVDVLVH